MNYGNLDAAIKNLDSAQHKLRGAKQGYERETDAGLRTALETIAEALKAIRED